MDDWEKFVMAVLLAGAVAAAPHLVHAHGSGLPAADDAQSSRAALTIITTVPIQDLRPAPQGR